MQDQIFQGIQYALANNTNIINGLGGTAIYRRVAPEEVALPYIITWVSGGGEENIAPDNSVDMMVSVKVITKNLAQAGTIASEIRNSLHEQNLNFGGDWKTLKITEESVIDDVINAEGSNFIHVGAMYRVRAVKYVPDYEAKVLATEASNLILFTPFYESGGDTAWDKSSQANNGTYNSFSGSVNLAATQFLDGQTFPEFDGSDDEVQLYTTAFDADFDGSEGSLSLWFKMNSASVWTDGSRHQLVTLRADANNRLLIDKSSTNNQLSWTRSGSGTASTHTDTSLAGSSGWHQIGITWSETGDYVRYYLDGANLAEDNTIGAWTGALNSNYCTIGAWFALNFVWSGSIGYLAIWDTPLSDAQMATLATV